MERDSNDFTRDSGRSGGNDELKRCISEDILLHPVADVPGTVAFMKSIFEVEDADEVVPRRDQPYYPADIPDAVKADLHHADHLVFILIDGLGMNIFNRLPDTGFLKAHIRTELRAVYPSATTCALVSIASTTWPCDHAITGWHTYLPEKNFTATVLPFTERISRRPLREFLTSAADVFPVESRISGISREVRAFMPEKLETGIFSEWFFRGAARITYRNLLEAFRLMRLRLDDAVNSGERSFTYLYVPVLDTTEHHFGPQHDGVFLELLGLDTLLRDFSRTTGDRARTVVTSDHGLIFVPKDRQYDLTNTPSIFDLLEHPPSGEARNPIFHVHPGKEIEFEERFLRFTKGDFLLVRPDEAEELNLFGPGRLSEEMRKRLGTFIGVAIAPAAVLWFPPGAPRYSYSGFHGGLSADEMRIPLVLF